MFKSARITLIIFLAISILPVSSAVAASRNSADLLKYVPADTPYVFASLRPMPDKLADKIEPTVDQVLRAYQRIIRYSVSEKLAEVSSDDGGAAEAQRVEALVDEVLDLMSVDGIRNAGVQRGSAFAFYGNGLLPVLRFELSDMKLFDEAIARIEDKAGAQLSIGTVGGKSYKYVEHDAIRLVIATLDEQAVLTVVPTEFDESQLAVALGLDKPRKNLAKSRELRSIAKKYGFSDYFTGFINNERIAGAFLGSPTGLNRDLLESLDYDDSELSEVCKSEFMEIAGIAPRIVFGYSTLNETHIDSGFVVELRSDIAEGLARLPAVVPGLGQDYSGLMSFGFSLNPLAARQFYEARLDALEADPFDCELLADMQDGVAAGRVALSKPVPPVVYGFRGILAVVDDIQGMDMASQKPPESMDASFLLAIENAQNLVAMAALLDAQIAALNLLPDGKPVKLEMAELAAIADEAFVALSEGALAVSVGKGAEAKAGQMLVTKSADPAPLMSMSLDAARYYGFIGEAMMQTEPDEGEEDMPMEVQSALQEAMTLIGSLYKRMRVDVRLTGRGIEMDSRLILAD